MLRLPGLKRVMKTSNPTSIMKLNKLIATLKDNDLKAPNVRVRYRDKEVDILSVYLSDDKRTIWIDIDLVDKPASAISLKDLLDDLRNECPKGANPKVKWAVDAFADDVRLKDIRAGRDDIWIDLEIKQPKRR